MTCYPKTTYAGRSKTWPTGAQDAPGTAPAFDPSFGASLPGERSPIDFATPSGDMVPTFRTVCERHGEVVPSPLGTCFRCCSPVEFVA